MLLLEEIVFMKHNKSVGCITIDEHMRVYYQSVYKEFSERRVSRIPVTLHIYIGFDNSTFIEGKGMTEPIAYRKKY